MQKRTTLRSRLQDVDLDVLAVIVSILALLLIVVLAVWIL